MPGDVYRNLVIHCHDELTTVRKIFDSTYWQNVWKFLANEILKIFLCQKPHQDQKFFVLETSEENQGLGLLHNTW